MDGFRSELNQPEIHRIRHVGTVVLNKIVDEFKDIRIDRVLVLDRYPGEDGLLASIRVVSGEKLAIPSQHVGETVWEGVG